MIVTFVIYLLAAARHMPGSLGRNEKNIFKAACLKVRRLNKTLHILVLIHKSPFQHMSGFYRVGVKHVLQLFWQGKVLRVLVDQRCGPWLDASFCLLLSNGLRSQVVLKGGAKLNGDSQIVFPWGLFQQMDFDTVFTHTYFCSQPEQLEMPGTTLPLSEQHQWTAIHSQKNPPIRYCIFETSQLLYQFRSMILIADIQWIRRKQRTNL